MPQLFLSYAHEDYNAATRLHDDLVRLGVDVWFDKESLRPGQQWNREIVSAIRNSDFFLVLLSTRSVTKFGVVQSEIREALDVLRQRPDGSIYILPARLEPVETSFELLNQIERVDLFEDWDRAVQRLGKAIGIIGRPGPTVFETQTGEELLSRVVSIGHREGLRLLSHSDHESLGAIVRYERATLDGVLSDILNNVRRHGRPQSDGPVLASVWLLAARDELVVRIENVIPKSNDRVTLRSTVAMALARLGGLSLQYESRESVFQIRISFPIASASSAA